MRHRTVKRRDRMAAEAWFRFNAIWKGNGRFRLQVRKEVSQRVTVGRDQGSVEAVLGHTLDYTLAFRGLGINCVRCSHRPNILLRVGPRRAYNRCPSLAAQPDRAGANAAARTEYKQGLPVTRFQG